MPQITPPKKLKQSRVQSTVTFTADETTKAEAKALEKLGESVKIEGFRPGRAPADMIRAKIDPGQLSEEAVRILLPGVFDVLLKEHKLQPIIPPKVDMTSKEPMILTLTFVEKPEVKVKGVDKINIKKTESKVDDKDVKRMIDYLQGQYRTTTPVDRASKDGDELTIDFVGTAEGTEVEGTRATDYKMIVGSKTLLPGFEEAVTGLKKGEQKIFTLTFPANYHAAHLQGKPVTFTATVKDIAEVHVPEFTDAFVKEHHLGESADDLRTKIKKSLDDQEVQADRARRERELFDAIRAATVIDLAPELVLHEQRMIFDEVARNLEREKLTMEEWLKQTDRTVEKLQKELEEEAQKRLTLRFAIQWLLDDKKIEASADDVSSALSDMLKNIPDAQRASAEAYYKQGGEGYEELKWRKRVEKLVAMMLGE